MVAVSLSVSSDSISRHCLEALFHISRSSRGCTSFSWSTLPGPRLYQRLSLYLFFCRRPLPVPRMHPSAHTIRRRTDDGPGFNCACKRGSAAGDFHCADFNSGTLDLATKPCLSL